MVRAPLARAASRSATPVPVWAAAPLQRAQTPVRAGSIRAAWRRQAPACREPLAPVAKGATSRSPRPRRSGPLRANRKLEMPAVWALPPPPAPRARSAPRRAGAADRISLKHRGCKTFLLPPLPGQQFRRRSIAHGGEPHHGLRADEAVRNQSLGELKLFHLTLQHVIEERSLAGI